MIYGNYPFNPQDLSLPDFFQTFSPYPAMAQYDKKEEVFHFPASSIIRGDH
jgi:type VI protein secretion system component VasK